VTQYWKILWACSLLLFMRVGSAEAAGYDAFFDTSFGDYSEELVRAREEGKKGILLFFEMKDCPFCHRMKETVLNQLQVQQYFKKHFLSFIVDIEGGLDITDFSGKEMTQQDFAQRQNRVRATPVIQIYDLQGKRVVRFTGATSGVEEFMWLGEYVVSGAYKEMPFVVYKRQRRR